MNYEGYEGCMMFDLDVVWGPISKFSGVILLVLGGFLCFIGGKFIRVSFAIFVFLAVSLFMFAIIYNLNLIGGLNEGNLTTFIIVGLVCMIVGGLVAYYTQKFANDWFVPIGGAVGAAALATLVLAAF